MAKYRPHRRLPRHTAVATQQLLLPKYAKLLSCTDLRPHHRRSNCARHSGLVTLLVPPIAHALLDALAVFFPVECAGCGVLDRAVCAKCQAQLVPEVVERTLSSGLPVYTALIYDSVPRRVLLALKADGRTEVIRFLAEPLRAALHSALTAPAEGPNRPAPAELALVPTSAAAWRRRGFDPVRLLCRQAGYHPPRLLVPTRRTRSQKTLGKQDRASNLAGSMHARMSLAGRQFVLVDDVLTTGATLSEASRAIEKGGGEVLSAVAVMYTRRIFRHAATRKEVLSDIAS
jgi:ComF family protein